MDFSWLNFALNAFTIAVLVGAAVFTARSRGNSNAAQEWREEAEAIRQRANRLHDELDESLKANREMQAQVAKLESLPDFAKILQEIASQREHSEENVTTSMKMIADMFERHENRAQERHEYTIQSFSKLNEGLQAINDNLRDG